MGSILYSKIENRAIMAKLQSNILSAEIVWMPSEEDLEELKRFVAAEKHRMNNRTLLTCKRVVSLCKYLSTAFNYAVIKFLDIRWKKGFSYQYFESTDEDLHNVTKKAASLSYSETLCSINCEINVERGRENYLKKLINLFCSCKRVGVTKHDLWMTFDIAELADDKLKSTSPTIDFKSFALGNFVGMNTFVSHFESTSALESHGHKITQIKGRFLHDFQLLELYFVVGKTKLRVKDRSPETHRLFKLEVPYLSVHRILVCDEGNPVAFLHFLYLPLLFGAVKKQYDDISQYRKQTDKEAGDSYISLLNCGPETDWERTLDLFEGSPVQFQQEFSMNTVLKLEFNSLNDYDCLNQLTRHCSHLEMYFSPVTVLPASQNFQINVISSKNFDSYYALKCIVSRSFEVYDHIAALDKKKEVNEFLSWKCKENPKLLSEVLFQIYEALDQGNVVIFSSALKSLFKKLESADYDLIYNESASVQSSQKIHTPKDYSLAKGEILRICRAVVTPTHVRFMLPQPVLKSRLLRSCSPDFALRVSVRDINLNGLSFTVRMPSGVSRRDLQVKFVTHHIKTRLLKGIKIGNRRYEYLGGSTSQLRSHGLWFYAKDDKNRSASNIRSTVGYLDEIYLVPKYMARMGQSLSQAMGFVTIPQEWTNVKCPEKDILGEKMIYASYSKDATEDEMNAEDYKEHLNSVFKSDVVECSSEESEVPDTERYNFTDGIGRMSQEIADFVYEKLELQNEAPSAMQIRYAGCKGMLTVDPQIEGKKIIFRASMKKFDSDSDSLEILKTSYPRLVYLNRPFVTILEQMGVKKEVFLTLQKLEIKQLIRSIFYNSDAENVLKSRSQLLLNYTGLCNSGFSLTEDPFFRSMILSIFRREIGVLKTKARILVPSDRGRTMFGVVDETSSLEYGEVFIQYTDFDTKDKDNTKIIDGSVLVTKNPCSHPGDVRIFRAVHKKELEHVRDCIVFPAKGPRPHPDEMAGSDLDGDEYSVIWHPELMFEGSNYPAMHFAIRSDMNRLDKPVEISDELDFFCKYIMNSSVGVIANSWLAWADKYKHGIFSDKCMSIAKKYSMALDFAKTGKPVQLEKGEYVFNYPDFMQKLSEKNTYLSNKALGHLYRNCKRLEIGFEATTSETKFALDKDLVYESWEIYKESALNTLKHYSHQICSSLKAYGIDQEGELVSGALTKVSKLYEERHDFSDLVNILEYEVKKLFQNLNKEFFAEFGGKPDVGEYSEEMRQKASAWYVVTYSQGQDKHNNETNYFGLPWAVTDILIDIKKMKSNQTEVDQAKSILSVLASKASFMEVLIDTSLQNRMASMTASPDYKLLVLDTAFDILRKWFKLQENNLVGADWKVLKNCLMKVFDEISSEVSCCDDQYFEYLRKSSEKRKINSPAYYILETLMRIAEIGTAEGEDENFDSYQELGLFAWVTLVKLGCSCSTEVLGITETAEEIPQGSYVTHNDEIEIIKIPLDKDKMIHSEKQAAMIEQFKCDVIHNEKWVKTFLQSQTQLKCIEMRAVEEKGKKYSLRLTVKGSRLSIERLKDLVVLPSFFESAVSWVNSCFCKSKGSST